MSRRTTKAVSAAVIVLLAVLTWWLQSGGDDRTNRAADPPTTTSSAGTRADVTTSPSDGTAPMPDRDEDGITYVALDDLPPEAADTVVLIDRGGPFPYPDRDGSTFGNFEGSLPDRPRGYYAEYTVETPGLSHRGARRIVAGDAGELYWTADHYESFERIWR